MAIQVKRDNKIPKEIIGCFCGENGDSCEQNSRICVFICRNFKRRICANLNKDRERVDRKKRYKGSFFNFLYPTGTTEIISPHQCFLPSNAV